MICETFQGTATTPQHSASFHEIDVERWVSSDEHQSPNEEEEENNNNNNIVNNNKDIDISIEEESFSPKSSSSPEPSGSSPEAEEFNSSPDDLDDLSNDSKWRASSTSSPSAALGTEVYRLCLPPDSPTTTTTTAAVINDIVVKDKGQQQENTFNFGEPSTTSERTAIDEAKDLQLAPTRQATIDGGVPPVWHQVRRKQRYSLDAGK